MSNICSTFANVNKKQIIFKSGGNSNSATLLCMHHLSFTNLLLQSLKDITHSGTKCIR